MYDGSHPTGKWQLYDIINDPAQNNNVADKHPDLLQQMISDYQKYSNDVGIVIPRDLSMNYDMNMLLLL
jgi:arylsulfatase